MEFTELAFKSPDQAVASHPWLYLHDRVYCEIKKNLPISCQLLPGSPCCPESVFRKIRERADLRFSDALKNVENPKKLLNTVKFLAQRSFPVDDSITLEDITSGEGVTWEELRSEDSTGRVFDDEDVEFVLDEALYGGDWYLKNHPIFDQVSDEEILAHVDTLRARDRSQGTHEVYPSENAGDEEFAQTFRHYNDAWNAFDIPAMICATKITEVQMMEETKRIGNEEVKVNIPKEIITYCLKPVVPGGHTCANHTRNDNTWKADYRSRQQKDIDAGRIHIGPNLYLFPNRAESITAPHASPTVPVDELAGCVINDAKNTAKLFHLAQNQFIAITKHKAEFDEFLFEKTFGKTEFHGGWKKIFTRVVETVAHAGKLKSTCWAEIAVKNFYWSENHGFFDTKETNGFRCLAGEEFNILLDNLQPPNTQPHLLHPQHRYFQAAFTQKPDILTDTLDNATMSKPIFSGVFNNEIVWPCDIDSQARPNFRFNIICSVTMQVTGNY